MKDRSGASDSSDAWPSAAMTTRPAKGSDRSAGASWVAAFAEPACARTMRIAARVPRGFRRRQIQRTIAATIASVHHDHCDTCGATAQLKISAMYGWRSACQLQRDAGAGALVASASAPSPAPAATEVHAPRRTMAVTARLAIDTRS
jgi:hypothetical protein